MKLVPFKGNINLEKMAIGGHSLEEQLRYNQLKLIKEFRPVLFLMDG